ncbi:TPA: hypothetical protein QH074_004323 [Enterobacter hormaechei subsp. steigerwaltii]|nr:hypothetical protein [Enterobacter hormaechei subsp. steigerwaltii]
MMFFQRVAARPIRYFFRLFGIAWLVFMIHARFTGLIPVHPFDLGVWLGAAFGCLIPAVGYSFVFVLICCIIAVVASGMRKSA